MHIPLMLPSEWREFASALFLAGKKNLMTARVSMLLKSRASPDMLPFSLCNKKRLAIRHMNRLFFPTLSIPSYDIWKQVGLRTYHHPIIKFTNLSGKYFKPVIYRAVCIGLLTSCIDLINDSCHFLFILHKTGERKQDEPYRGTLYKIHYPPPPKKKKIFFAILATSQYLVTSLRI